MCNEQTDCIRADGAKRQAGQCNEMAYKVDGGLASDEYCVQETAAGLQGGWWFDPFTAPACKTSWLKDTRTRL